MVVCMICTQHAQLANIVTATYVGACAKSCDAPPNHVHHQQSAWQKIADRKCVIKSGTMPSMCFSSKRTC